MDYVPMLMRVPKTNGEIGEEIEELRAQLAECQRERDAALRRVEQGNEAYNGMEKELQKARDVVFATARAIGGKFDDCLWQETVEHLAEEAKMLRNERDAALERAKKLEGALEEIAEVADRIQWSKTCELIAQEARAALAGEKEGEE